jgi:arylsulfatase
MIIAGGWLAVVAGGSRVGQAVDAAENPPNVLVILADDLGFSDLSCYGGEIQTPHLDALAANGIRCTQFYNTGRCWPTRAALLTGYYAQQVGRDRMPGHGGGANGNRPSWAVLLPERLKPYGYRSYHSGKWHVDGKRLAGGFDRSYSLEDHDRFFAPRRHLRDDQPLEPVSPDAEYYASTAIADHAIECLQDHAAHFRQQPFFHYLCFTAPHFPLHAPPEDIARYQQRYADGWEHTRTQRWQRIRELGLVNGVLSSVEPAIGPPYHFPEALEKLGENEVNRPVPWETLTDEQRAFQAAKMAVHAAMVDRMDQEIGRVLAQLDAMDARHNTLVLFLSDNGASAEIMVRGDGHDTPFRRHKTWVHEGGIATPLIAHWPAGIEARGELRTDPGHVIDLVPTVMELVGADVNSLVHADSPILPGQSLVPMLKRTGSASGDSRPRTLWWLHEGNRAIRQGDWKLVAAEGEAWQLYDLSKDRAETNDLANELPEKVEELKSAWQLQLEEIQKVRATESGTAGEEP